MLVVNDIPLLALIIEPIVFVCIFVVFSISFRKYLDRKSEAIIYLSLTMLFLSLSVLSSSIGKYLDFFSSVPQSVKSYSGFFINIAYCFSAISNYFLFSFTNEIFLEWKGWTNILFAALNGITIGLIIPRTTLEYGAYGEIIYILGFHVVVSLIIAGILIVASFKSSSSADEIKQKTGFIMIGMYGIFQILVFGFFITDLILISLTESVFSTFYYLAWISAAFGTLCAYLGYIMPNWFVKIFE